MERKPFDTDNGMKRVEIIAEMMPYLSATERKEIMDKICAGWCRGCGGALQCHCGKERPSHG